MAFEEENVAGEPTVTELVVGSRETFTEPKLEVARPVVW